MYPVTYEADYLKERNRLTAFFRLIVVIPWIIVAAVYMIAVSVVVLIAWFALVILGRYPEGMYNFVGGILRFSMRVTAFVTLQTDAWPSFGLKDEPDYPVRVRFAPPAARQSRLKAFFRIILIIPLLLMSYLFSAFQQAVAILAWVTIVFRGYQPAGVHNALAFTNSWYTRAYAYMMIMRDEYPPVGDEVEVEVDPPAAIAAPAPAALATATEPAPEAAAAETAPETAAQPEAPSDAPDPPADPGSPRP